MSGTTETVAVGIARFARSGARLDWRLRFAALGLIWGFIFLFIKLGTQAYAPLQVVLGRMAFGALTLVIALWLKRERLPRGAALWARLSVAAFLLNTVPFTLFAYAEQTIPSALAGICNATTPLWSMVLSVVALSEDRPTRHRIAGVGLGFAGVLVVLGAWQGFSGEDTTGTALALGAALSYAIGWIYVRRALSSAGSNLTVAAGQLMAGTAQLTVLTVAFTSLPASFPAAPTLAIVALGVVGTGYANLLQFGLVHEKGPTIAMMATYMIPPVATVAGVLLLGEHLSWNVFVGAAIILTGAALTQRR